MSRDRIATGIVRLVLSAFALFCAGRLAAVTAGDTALLFVDSVPRGASVVLDGVLLEDVTPLIVREIYVGHHALEFRRAGHLNETIDLDLGVGPQRTSVELIPAGVSVALPRVDEAIVAGIPVTAGEGVLQLSGDRYLLAREGGAIYIEPSPLLLRLTDGLTIAAPIMALFTGIMTVDAVTRPPVDGSPVPAALVAAHIATAVVIGVDVALHIVRFQQLHEFSVSVEARGDPERERQTLLRAEETLGRGYLDDALTHYLSLIEDYPNSDLVAEALFRAASIQVLRGNGAEGEELFARVVSEYPVAELFDVSLKNLADLASQRGDYASCMRYLGEMAFFHSPFTKNEIYSYGQEIHHAWVASDPGASETADLMLAALEQE